MKNKITNRTQVYRAIYYSGFNWTKTKIGDNDSYKLVEKETSNTIYIEHVFDKDLNMDQLIVKTTNNLSEKELARFSRLCHKIMRRTKNLGIKQDLIELSEEQPKVTKETENA